MLKPVPATLRACFAPLLLLAVAAALLTQRGTAAAQGPVLLGTDTDPKGNTATSLGTAEGCVSVDTGDTFEFDIYIADVNSLIAWELYVRFSPSIVELVDADMEMFLANNPRSSLKTLSVPLSGGRHFLGAADLRGAPESGSGVLARLTLRAGAPGLSQVDIPYIDVNNDGRMDIGPRLTGSGGVAVGDVTGDGVFDGPTQNSLIAVGRSCGFETPTSVLPPSPTPGAQGGSSDASTGGPDGTTNGGTESPDGGQEPPAPAGNEPDETDAPDEANPDNPARDDTESAVLGSQGTPAPAQSGGGPTSGQAGDGSSPSTSSSSSSSAGGVPLWAIAFIGVAALLVAAGAGVYLAARSGSGAGQ